MPYHFLDDIATADVAFEAWGGTREEMFSSAAEALLGTMVAAPAAVKGRRKLIIQLENDGLDLLLFSFLQELVFYKDARRLLLHADSVRVEERQGVYSLEVCARGEKIDDTRHQLLVDVKAVTLYRLDVRQHGGIWKAVVVLDV